MTARCLFSGEATENEEHVVPAWMQRRFGLANQTYHLPNGSRIAYRNCKVPAAEAHNSRFGEIEDRVARGVASPQEVYLWALKIHVGLIFKDAVLRTDIRDPGSTTFWDVDDFGQEVQLFQMLYETWASGGRIDPTPFGTVFVFDALTPAPEFDFCHELRSGTVFFQLGERLVFASLWDQGDGMSGEFLAFLETHRAALANESPELRQAAAHLRQRIWACETAYVLYRARRAFTFMRSNGYFALVPPLGPPLARAVDVQELAGFCRSFGLRLVWSDGERAAYESWLPQDGLEPPRSVLDSSWQGDPDAQQS